MNKPASKELRSAQRFNLQNPVRLFGGTLPRVEKPTGAARAIDGHVQNMSRGGLCLVANKRLKVSELLVGEISIPGTQATIPTLLQVRWLAKNALGPRYRAGLHYILQPGMTEALQASTNIGGLAATGVAAKRKSSKRK